MGKSVHIIKIGQFNSVTNVVSEEAFKKVYEPKGWVLDENFEIANFKVIEEEEQEFKTTNPETIIQVERSKKVRQRKFNDNIIKD